MRRSAVAVVFGAALLLGACAVQNQAGDGGADGGDAGGSRTINGIVVEAGAEYVVPSDIFNLVNQTSSFVAWQIIGIPKARSCRLKCWCSKWTPNMSKNF